MSTHSIELQHINVNLLLKVSDSLDHGRDLDPVIPVFHSWIQGQVFDELLLDVADYRHVQGGPGVMLIGHEADYSLDHTDNRWGIRYNRKARLEGANQDRLAQATLAALRSCQQIQEDTRLNGKLHFNGHEIEIFVNDRASAPNTAATREALNAEFRAFSERLLHGADYSLSFGNDSRRLLAVRLEASRAFTVEELIENLKAADQGRAKHPPSGVSSDAELHEELKIAQGAD